MRRVIVLFLFFGLSAARPSTAEDPDNELSPESLAQETNRAIAADSWRERIFVVETDAQSARESLDRISGQYDRGYAKPSQTYRSSSHYRPGPFGREEALKKTSKSDNP